MIKSLNTAATGMAAQQTNMDVISNNIANVSTTGFKKSRAEFEDLMYHTEKEPGAATGMNTYSPNGVQTGLGVRTSSIKKDFVEGNTLITKRSLDLEIEGAGFFQVSTPDGGIGYTRDGAFTKDANGKVVDKNGNALLPEINIPANATAVEISRSGNVSIITAENNVPQSIGQIDIANFINPAGLKAMGKNVFVQTGASGNPVVATPGQSGMGALSQGSLETSNVNIVEEMVNMITTQRAYETNSKVVQTVDQMLSTINNMR